MTRPALIGDIGGTNARFALVTPGAFEPHDILSLPCAEYPGLVEAVDDYLTRVGAVGNAAPHEACLAFACPIRGDQVTMTNNHWTFSRAEAQAALGLTLFKVINDFTAQALGVPHVAEQDLVEVQPGQAIPHSARLVIGPGTGLGVAGLFPGRHAWIPLPTEGGHVTFAATDEREQNLLRHFRNRYGRVSVERLLCGQGLLDLYLAHCSLKGANPAYATPAEVTQAAEHDPVARDTLLRFLKILGDVCGDAALTIGARGGVYLCGGILPRLLDWLPQSRFGEAFAAKGRMSAYTAAIPVQVVTAPWVGLLGAAEALHNEEVE
ncbi:glucokinase [Halomonas urumqiensis]|uniref:Glucokinase n=1 Tax=Halomonas urumqiensis TaxID=1684789 RepID=A0A2N7UHI6_9GAMM|nr:glucokinase [Halomonas urumqiensis]PMR79894.1 glucokinase [Halomonas urumqiensis]PTB02081.1 glucokinase [Halomonas urumqiensis]GHE21523.1 glucokinase [Halomonas urumqiensis]